MSFRLAAAGGYVHQRLAFLRTNRRAVRGGLVAASEEQHARNQEDHDSCVAGPSADVAADGVTGEQTQDRHPGLEGGEDQGDPKSMALLEARDAEGCRQGERVQGEGEEEAGGDQRWRHARSLTGLVAHRTPVW